MAVDEEMKKRLIYAKYLFLHGQEHARENTAVSRMIAIHNFDNAVEWALKCVASERRLKPKKGRYFFYDELLDGMRDLPLIVEMEALHDQRNSVQHYGNIPSGEGTTRYMKEAEDFLKSIVKEMFQIEFYKLSLASLIEDESIRSLMAEAEKKLGEDDYEGSIKLSSNAFYLAAIRLQKKFNELLETNYSFGFSNYSDFQQLDISFRDFIRFRSITPMLSEFSEKLEQGDLSSIDKWSIRPDKLTDTNAQICLNFSLEFIIKWQSFWKEAD